MRRIVALGFMIATAVGCTSDPPAPQAPPAPVVANTIAAPESAPVLASREPASDAFDSARTRDPFVADVVADRAPIVYDDVPRKAKRFTLDDLKLVGIASSDGVARAML